MSFTETLQSITGKLLADCTDQELYLALLELVRQKSADRVQPVTGRKLYYISAEFLIGKLLSNNLINLGLYEEARDALAAAGKRLSDIEEVEPEAAHGHQPPHRQRRRSKMGCRTSCTSMSSCSKAKTTTKVHPLCGGSGRGYLAPCMTSSRVTLTACCVGTQSTFRNSAATVMGI